MTRGGYLDASCVDERRPKSHGWAVINGKFYVVGGRGSANAATALEAYDPQTNSWSSRAPMPTGRSGIAAAAVNRAVGIRRREPEFAAWESGGV